MGLALWTRPFLLHGTAVFGLPYPDSPWLVALHNLSDLVIGLCYAAIAATLVVLVHRARRAIPFGWMFLAFGAFIIACGASHLMHVVTVWQPDYWWLLAIVQAVTVAASGFSALLLPPLVPKALALVEAAQLSTARKGRLEAANADLEREIAERRRAEAVLQESEARFRGAFDYAAVGMALVAPDGRWLQVNRALCAIVGYAEHELLATTFQAITHPDDLATDLSHVRRLLAGEIDSYQMEKRYLHRRGHQVWVLLSVSLVRDTAGQPLYFVSQIQDITERRRAAAALRQSEARHRAVVDTAFDAIITMTAAGTIQSFNRGAERIFGHATAQVLGQPLTLLMPYRLRAAHVAGLQRYLATGEARVLGRTLELVGQHRDGAEVPLELSITRIECEGEPLFTGILRDITERKVFEAELRHQAYHDPLTGLPTRALLLERLEHALARATRQPHGCAVLYLDLDRFKAVNDSLGHACGDDLLRAVAQCLRRCLRQEDTAARLGGDEFAILLEDIADAADAIRVAERLIATCQAPFILDGREVIVTPSLGIAFSTADHDDAEGLLQAADLAMYRAKARGGAGYEVFDPSMAAAARERLELEGELRHAIERDQLRIYYQPKVELATGTIAGVEALVRWEHPTRGLISPAAFIPLAEETGLIHPIGRWVLATACQEARRWHVRHPGAPPLRVCVNLSARQFQHPELVEEVAWALRRAGLAPQRLVLEITEGVVMEAAEATIGTLRRLKNLGVQLGIDDFGTGYSSLSYLKRFPVDLLKIDRAFVAGLGRDAEDTAIVGAIVALAHRLGLAVVAEGVETAEQADALRALGCEWGQGYYFAEPQTADGLDRLLGAAYDGQVTPQRVLRAASQHVLH